MHQTQKRAFDAIAKVLATGFGVGFIPIAPGTFGSLIGVALAAGLAALGATPVAFVLVGIGMLLLGVPISERVAKSYGVIDPQQVVFDEITAFPFVFCAVQFNLATAIAGFLWFRLFDILKPWPVHRLETLPGGWGIMSDDAAAGVLAGAALWGTVYLFGSRLGM